MTLNKVYIGLEQGLNEANRIYLISCDKSDIIAAKKRVEKIIYKIVNAMKEESSTFSKLYWKIFGVGSIYEEIKIGKPNEFDIDILLRLPQSLQLSLEENTVAGFAKLQLKDFECLSSLDSQLYRDMKIFIDSNNYLLSEEMMCSFIQKIFNNALRHFPNNVIKIENEEYKISKIQYIQPALTLTIESSNFHINIDLVASFILNKNYWPETIHNNNPHAFPSDFFVVPARPVDKIAYKERLWRLSFHIQERQLIHNRHRMKAAVRVLKRIRDHFEHPVHSHAIKTLFLWELSKNNPALKTTALWKSPLSSLVIWMLEQYVKCLDAGKILDFWNPKHNLLSYLSSEDIQRCRQDIALMIDDIKERPHCEVLLSYLK
ncbi:cyclic GMP-AMP synthase-like [Tribolium madens]|uniref:cyclic GMP-AMP synthase-like n=1 Tax=Tribolium madens TaxID=41895 RepID=UPI001CF761DE|nr:cyclic GMP-AMP synthase-like [Tribolium madens]